LDPLVSKAPLAGSGPDNKIATSLSLPLLAAFNNFLSLEPGVRVKVKVRVKAKIKVRVRVKLRIKVAVKVRVRVRVLSCF
jgi:hypothetical protein